MEKTTDYTGNFVYQNSSLKMIITDDGRLLPDSTSFVYEHFIKDHLGNTRVVVGDNEGVAEVMQESHYYPFGMRMEGMSYTAQSLIDNGTGNKYLYNGKELQDDLGLGWYDYGKRFYDPVIARWNSVDSLAEHPNQIHLTPYQYAWNNPINLNDPDGNCPWCVVPAAIAAVDALLIATGIVTTGIILSKAQDGSFQLNRDTRASENWGRKREGDSKRETNKIKTKHNKSTKSSGYNSRGSSQDGGNGKKNNSNVSNFTKAVGAVLIPGVIGYYANKAMGENTNDKPKKKNDNSDNSNQPLWSSDPDYWNNGLNDTQRNGYMNNMLEQIKKNQHKKDDESSKK